MSFSVHSISPLLWGLLLAGYFIVAGFLVRKGLSQRKRRWWLTCRVLIVTCLALVLAGAGMALTPRVTTTIFLVDNSLSVREQKAAITEYINEQLGFKNSKDQVGVITFAGKPMVEIPVTGKVNEVELTARPDPNFTDLERAIDFALACFPQGTNRRLVLFSDGQENAGSVASLGEKLRNSKVNLLVYPLLREQRQDVQFSSLDIPTDIFSAARLPVEVTLESTWAAQGTLYLYAGGKQVLQKEVAVKEGANYLEFDIPNGNQETIVCRGEIDFKGDTNPGNDKLTTTVVGRNRPQILVVGAEEDVEIINSLLESLPVGYRHYQPSLVPETMGFLAGFQAVILVNVPQDTIAGNFEKNLARCVQEIGTGLLVIGGESSFALGGYEQTLLEEMLPVRCRMKGNKKQPNLGLILSIDASGSMEDESAGIKKIELAKEAARRTVEILEPEDYLGILAFADTLEWIVPYGPAEDKSAIKESIGKLGSKGGTLIIPSLAETLNTLQESSVKIKHAILLTDGQGEQEGFQAYAEAMQENKITLSTVAVGQDADGRILAYLADSTGGRKYFAADFHSVPQIITRETYLATRKYLNNEEFTPIQVQETRYFPAVPLPPLKGYVGTGLKDRANLILKSPEDDPVLATWNYGLGKTAAWTSDLNGQ